MAHHFDRSGRLTPVLESCPPEFKQAIARLRDFFPEMEIEPESEGHISFQAKHAGKWRAWHFEDGVTPDALAAAEAKLRSWANEAR